MAQSRKLAAEQLPNEKVAIQSSGMRLYIRILCFPAILLILFGCDVIGPSALNQSRPDYNEVIRQTTKTQNFMNLVRVRCHEPTFFMDVSEVDVALQWQGSVTGSFSFPQARAVNSTFGGFYYDPGHDYSVGGTMQYLETPTIRYFPLSGQALFAQISAPIGVDSIAAMIDSQWPVSSVLTFALTRLTPVDKNFYEALDALIALGRYPFNALVFIPTHAEPSSSGPNDTLKVYFMRGKVHNEYHQDDNALTSRCNKLWHKLWAIYGPSQPVGAQEYDDCIELRTQPRAPDKPEGQIESTTDYDDSSKIIKKSVKEWSPKPDSKTLSPTEQPVIDHSIDLYNLDSAEASSSLHSSKFWPQTRPYQLMPVIRTRSALGILRDVTQPDLDWDLVAFVPADSKDDKVKSAVKKIRLMIEKFATDFRDGNARDFYIFDSSIVTGQTHEANDRRDPFDDTWGKVASSWPIDDLPPSPLAQVDKSPTYKGVQDYYEENSLLDNNNLPDRGDRLRHFVIIFYQSALKLPPLNAYVSANCHGQCFYIDGHDVISQRNFALISHFLTIQAVPQAAPLTPTIGVGTSH